MADRRDYLVLGSGIAGRSFFCAAAQGGFQHLLAWVCSGTVLICPLCDLRLFAFQLFSVLLALSIVALLAPLEARFCIAGQPDLFCLAIQAGFRLLEKAR